MKKENDPNFEATQIFIQEDGGDATSGLKS